MKILIIYDSSFGNTEKVAHAIADALVINNEVNMVHPEEAHLTSMVVSDLVIVGSPTQGGRPTPLLQKFLDSISYNALTNTRVATFDTRFAPEDHGLGLRILMTIIGFAAGKIAKVLRESGGIIVGGPEGFIVEGKKGPLKPGELKRAQAWAKGLLYNNASHAI